jgi:hypothetical protein
MTETKWRNDRSWPKADLNLSGFCCFGTSAYGKSGHYRRDGDKKSET